MPAAKLESNTGFLTMSWEFDGYDYQMSVEASSYEYRGVASAYVSAEELSAFKSSLIALEEKRQGKATLASISPGEVDITVCSIDKLGHMGVLGKLQSRVYSANGVFNNALQFEFEFDPFSLPRFVKAFRYITYAT